jgi:hypothetical protein
VDGQVIARSDSARRDKFLQFVCQHRMPVMAYVAVDRPRTLSDEDWVRLGLAATLHPDEQVPVNDPTVVNFTSLYCQDRFWTNSDAGPNTRFICTGNALTVVGDSASGFFADAERGVLAQFRHQYFLAFFAGPFAPRLLAGVLGRAGGGGERAQYSQRRFGA